MIGATGGSGTRVVARIVRAGGMYIGRNLNRYEDALDFGYYSDRWINRYLASGREGPDAALAEEMASDLRSVVADHCAGLPAETIRWGWKEPRSIYLLPFLREQLPTLRFLHFVRDGRDMAFSDNQKQLRKHGPAALAGRLSWRQPVRSIALWSRVNQSAADYGERGARFRLSPGAIRRPLCRAAVDGRAHICVFRPRGRPGRGCLRGEAAANARTVARAVATSRREARARSRAGSA